MRAQDNFVQGKNLGEHVHLDRAFLLTVDLDQQLLYLHLDLITLLLVLHLLELAFGYRLLLLHLLNKTLLILLFFD